ncbi:NAD-dependent epimerase/dehydratase family protein [Tsuneonella troitsensis]|uniref:NAD-dependent epimerase/dehydratase family protein n=1 Tax=Tsuneonella troitsensis TaxID=292222 RepID=UPI0007089C59|nr:NAD(P)-dependent oxidoreductase [Tsuneonella troitsensis]
MKVFLTGAGGFLGSAITNAAAASGHSVLALYRPCSRIEPPSELVEPVKGDLRQRGDWTEKLAEANCVVHCAAAASGDLATQLTGTVLATENLLAALPEGLQRFVHISSFSVYDFSAPGPFGRLDEESVLEPHPLRRDAYTQTKLIQERMIRAHCNAKDIPLVVLRPGAIYRTAADWDYGRALRAGPFDLIFGPLSSMRLVHVDDCASAVIAAIDAPLERELVINIVGSKPITYWGLYRRARQSGEMLGIPIPVPYMLVRMLGGAAWVASRVFFEGRARLPEWLDLPRQEARWRSLSYSNRRARAELGWHPDRDCAIAD